MTTSPLHTIRTVKELRHVADYLGSKFFSKENMRFNSTRLSERVYRLTDTSGYFVTSDVNPFDANGVRVYTIRKFAVERFTRKDGRACDRVVFDTVGSVGHYTTLKDAQSTAAALMLQNEGK